MAVHVHFKQSNYTSTLTRSKGILFTNLNNSINYFCHPFQEIVDPTPLVKLLLDCSVRTQVLRCAQHLSHRPQRIYYPYTRL